MKFKRLAQRATSTLSVCLRKPPDVVANTRKRRGETVQPQSSLFQTTTLPRFNPRVQTLAHHRTCLSRSHAKFIHRYAGREMASCLGLDEEFTEPRWPVASSNPYPVAPINLTLTLEPLPCYKMIKLWKVLGFPRLQPSIRLQCLWGRTTNFRRRFYVTFLGKCSYPLRLWEM